jgi:hypothetical protein
MAAPSTAEPRKRLSHFNRFVYAFFLGVFAVGIGTVLEIVLAAESSSFRISGFIYSPTFFVPAFVVGYLAAPWLARSLRFGQ